MRRCCARRRGIALALLGDFIAVFGSRELLMLRRLAMNRVAVFWVKGHWGVVLAKSKRAHGGQRNAYHTLPEALHREVGRVKSGVAR